MKQMSTMSQCYCAIVTLTLTLVVEQQWLSTASSAKPSLSASLFLSGSGLLLLAAAVWAAGCCSDFKSGFGGSGTESLVISMNHRISGFFVDVVGSVWSTMQLQICLARMSAVGVGPVKLDFRKLNHIMT